MDACFSTVYSMSTIVLCLLVGSTNIVLKIQSVVTMHKENKYVSVIRDIRDNRDGIVISVLDQRPRGRGFESAGCGLSCSNCGTVALCTLSLGLLNPPSSRGR